MVLKTPFIHWAAATLNRSHGQSNGTWQKVLWIPSFCVFLFGCKISYFWHMMGIYICKCSTCHSDRLGPCWLCVLLTLTTTTANKTLGVFVLQMHSVFFSNIFVQNIFASSIFLKHCIFKGFKKLQFMGFQGCIFFCSFSFSFIYL